MMRTRVLAFIVAVFAGIDLLFLSLAPVVGWIDMTGLGQGSVVILALSFFLALLALVGALSILATSWHDADDPVSRLEAMQFSCTECGREPDLSLAFCHGCGAAV